MSESSTSGPGSRPFTRMAVPHQGDRARNYAVVMSLLQELSEDRPLERFHYAMREGVDATLAEIPEERHPHLTAKLSGDNGL